MTTHSARVHILLAREAPTALILRRGPTKCVCTLSWNRDDDSLKVGQWLKGRIDGRSADLSPDGKHFFYGAFNDKWNQGKYREWTAISYAPYLKAIGFWPRAWGYSGGLFLSNERFWLADSLSPNRFPHHLHLTEDWSGSEQFAGKLLKVYYLRLLHDGWTTSNTCTWEKRIGASWTLLKTVGTERDQHLLINHNTNEEIDGKTWEWADFDGSRLLWAEGGKIFARTLCSNTFGEINELFDLNDMSFEPLVAPY